MASAKSYKYILDRVLALKKFEPTEFNKRYSEYPVEIIARWIQRRNEENGYFLGDELVDEEYTLKHLLPDMVSNFRGEFSFIGTPEGLPFWNEVSRKDFDAYYDLYPIVNDNDSISQIRAKAEKVIEVGWDKSSGLLKKRDDILTVQEMEGFPVLALVNMLVNQALQGNQMDSYLFNEHKFASLPKGGFNWILTPQGDAFWTAIIEEGKYNDINFSLSDNDISKFPESSLIRESIAPSGTGYTPKESAKELVKELDEGENRVEYFRDTKKDSLKEFAKDFPEAEAPLNKLLDLLSIKEDGRLKKSPKKKKKKESKPAEKKPTWSEDATIQIIDLPYPLKGKSRFIAPISAEKREDWVDYEKISQVWYFIIEKRGEGVKEYKVTEKDWFGLGIDYDKLRSREGYEENVLGAFMEIKVDKYNNLEEYIDIVTKDKDYVFKVRIIYKDGSEEQLSYDSSTFELFDEDAASKDEGDLDAEVWDEIKRIRIEKEKYDLDALLQEGESEAELTAKDITELIEGLELGLEYLDGNDKKDATEQIEGLKITLDYI